MKKKNSKGFRVLIVLRSIPGGGKTTYAKQKFPDATVCSADHFFEDEDGNYNFNFRLLGKAHGACKNKCLEAMKRGDEEIVIDNTNTTQKEFSPYLKMAQKHNYVAKVIRINCTPEVGFERNTHGVPLEAIRRMHGRMAPFSGEKIIEADSF